jgi:exodeoxyribonuclease-5
MAVCNIEGAIKYIENLYDAVPSTPKEKFTKDILGSLVQSVNATRATVRDAASFVANAGPIDIGMDLTPYLSTLEDAEQPSSTGMIAGMVLGETKSMEVSEFLDLLSEISADVDSFKGLNVPYAANVALSTYTQVIREFVATKGASPINVKLVTQVIHGASNTEHLAIFRKKTNTLEIAMHPSGNVDASALLLPTAKAALSAIVVVLTEQGLADNPKLDSMVTALRTKVMRLQEGKKGAPSMAKGLSSNQNFIAETLTSFRFQKLLASLTGEKNTVKTKLVRIFKRLINTVKMKMNIAVGTPTLLEEALALVELSISTTKEEEAYIRGMDIPLEEYSIVEELQPTTEESTVVEEKPVPETPPWEVDPEEGSSSYKFKSTLVDRSLGEYKDGALNIILKRLRTRFNELQNKGDTESVEFSNVRDDIRALITHLSNAKSARESQKETTQSGFVPGKGYLVSGNMYTNTGQTAAIDAMKNWYSTASKSFMLQGRGGTGKTTVISVLLKELGLKPSEVAFAAPTNKAKKVLKKANSGTDYAGNEYFTVAQLLGIKESTKEPGTFEKDDFATLPTIPKLLIIDEASMLHSDNYESLMSRIAMEGGKIVFMGDHAQLPPVKDSKAPIKSVVFDRTVDSSTLTELMRQAKDSPIINFTNKLINLVMLVEGNLSAGKRLEVVKNRVQGEVTDGTLHHKFDYDKNEGVIVTDEAFERILPSFINDYKQNPETTKYIHFNNHTHEDTRSKTASIRKQLYGDKALTEEFIVGEPLVLNAPYMEDALSDDGLLDNGEEFTVVSSRISKEYVIYKVGKNPIKSGDPIEMHIIEATNTINGSTHTFRKPVGGVKNKEAILNAEEAHHPDKPGRAYQLLTSLAFNLGHGYVINTHKSQGSTYDNVYMDLGNIAGQPYSQGNDMIKSMYVAASRPRKKLVVIDSRQVGTVINPGALTHDEHVAPAFKGVDKAESSDIIDKRNKCDGKG